MDKHLPLLFLIVVSSLFEAFGQTPGTCGTIITESEAKQMRKAMSQYRRSVAYQRQEEISDGIDRIAVVAHIVHTFNGYSTLTEADVAAALADANEYFAQVNIEFFLFQVNKIKDSKFYNLDLETEEEALAEDRDVANTINIYFTQGLSRSDNNLCGAAYYPGGPDRIFMANGCTTNGTTFTHELGHFFTLIHTHGSSNTLLTDELVNGTNCSTAGDEICDTPADPQLGYHNLRDCDYTGDDRDANGDRFEPDPANIMSYAAKECREKFTSEQYARIADGNSAFRSYLYSKTVMAKFTTSIREVCSGGTVTFRDKSINADTLHWDFGGGVVVSDDDDGVHVTYGAEGTYDVTLVAINGEESDTVRFEDHILVREELIAGAVEVYTSFEDDPLTEKIINPDEEFTFEGSDYSTHGKRCATIKFFEYNSPGAEDMIILPALKVEGKSALEFTFDYAHAVYEYEYDKLEVVYRESACDDWQTIWEKSGFKLSTAPASESKFLPSREDWKSERINFTVSGEHEVVEVAFRATNDYGNNLYIDNVWLGPKPAFHLAYTNVVCNGGQDGSITLSDFDPDQYFEFSLDGEHFQTDSVFTNLAAGMYTVHIRNEKGDAYQRTLEILEPEPISVRSQVICTDVTENFYSETLEVSFTIEETLNSEGPWYLIEGNDTLYHGSNPYIDMPPGNHQIQVVDAVTGCSTSFYQEITILDQLNIVAPEPLPGDEHASVYVDVTYRGPGDSLMYTLYGSEEWHPLSDTITGLEIGSGGDIRVKNFAKSGQACSLYGYFRGTAPGFISIDKKDAGCKPDGQISVSNAEPEVWGEEYPYRYGINKPGSALESTFRDLAPGIYTVYVLDDYGESEPELTTTYRTKNVEVGSSAGITLAVETFCEGGIYRAQLTPSDWASGEGPWEYTLNDTLVTGQNEFTNLLPGDHQVVVENLATACTAEASFSITALDAVEAKVSQPAVGESTGAVIPSVEYRGTGDSLQYQVTSDNFNSSWVPVKDTLFDVPAGSYQLAVRNEVAGHTACQVVDDFSIVLTEPLIVTLNVLHPRCNGGDGSVTAEATGGRGDYSYSLNAGDFQENNAFDMLSAGSYELTVRDSEGREKTTPFDITEPDPISVHVSLSGTICPDDPGYVTITASGGSGDYSYIVDGESYDQLVDVPVGEFASVISGLTTLAGEHTFTVVDGNDCTHSVNLDVVYDGAIASMQVEGSVCYDFGSLGVSTAEVGNHYILNDPANDTGFSAEQCMESGTLEFSPPTPLEAAISIQTEQCSSTTTIETTGGTPPYVYQLDNEGFVDNHLFDNIALGEHVITVRDANGCLKATPFVMEEASVAPVVAVKDVTCEGDADGAIMVQSDHDYVCYSDGKEVTEPLENLPVGTYQVEFTGNHGCVYQEEYTVGYTYAYPSIPVIRQEDGMLQIDETDYEITWYLNGEELPGENTNQIENIGGSYQVSLAAPGGNCEVFSEVITVLSLADELVKEINIYPNPVVKTFSISLPEHLQPKVTAVSVMNLSGQILFQSTRLSNISINEAAGVYLVRIEGAGFETTKRIILK